MDKTEIISEVMKLLSENKDSLEIGTAGKGGAIKIYCNMDDVEATKKKIDNAILARQYAQSKMDVI